MLFKDYSIKSRISIIIFIILSLGGLVLSLFSYYYTRQALLDLEREKFEIEIAHTSDLVSDVFDEAKMRVSFLASHNEFASFLQSYNIEEDLKLHEIYHMSNIDNFFSNIYLLNSEGNIVSSTNLEHLNQNFSYRPYFYEALSGNDYIYVAKGNSTNVVGYYLSKPIYDKTDSSKVIGVIVGKFDSQVVGKVIQTEIQNKSVTSKFKILDNNGIIVYSSNADELYHPLSEVNSEIIEKITVEKQFPLEGLKSTNYYLDFSRLKTVYLNKVVSLSDLNTSKDIPQEYIYFTGIDDTPYYILGESSLAEIMLSARQYSLKIAIFIISFSAFIIALVYLILNNSLSSIGMLSKIASEIAEGNFSKKFRYNYNDELSTLVNAINKMSGKLLKLKDNLEDEVEKKTNKLSQKLEQLEKLNTAMIGRELKMLELKEQIRELKEELNKNEK